MKLPRLMLVVDSAAAPEGMGIEERADLALSAGVRLIQLRGEWVCDDARVHRFVKDLPGKVIVLLNGRIELARALRTGVHLPAAVEIAARPDVSVFGRAVHDVAETGRAVHERADYLVAGHVFDTESKPGLAGRGVEFLRGICAHAETTPVFAIGGIRAERVAQVRNAGAHGVAVCRAILASADPGAAARLLLDAVGEEHE